MPDYVALLRGVNVGGAKKVPMADFRALLGRIGYTDVATLLNSGNAVYGGGRGSTASHAAAIRKAIADRLKIDVPVIVKSAREFAAIVTDNPFAGVAAEPARLLVVFVQDPSHLATLAPVRALVRGDEGFVIGQRAAYFHCPAGILQSKAGEALLGRAGSAATTRNWATTLKLQALLQARAG